MTQFRVMAFWESPVLQQFTILIYGLVYPVYALVAFSGINRRINQNEAYRMKDYRSTIILFLALTLLVLVNLISGLPVAIKIIPELGLPAVIFSILILAFIIVQARQKVGPDDLRVIRTKMEPVWPYMPKNKKELNYFIVLSCAAAICEELVFRFYLYHTIKEWGIATWMTVVIVNVLFSVTHVGSGARNMLSTFFLGIVFSIIYYFSGTILLPIILHAAIDIGAGTTSILVHRGLSRNQEEG